jgi:hypothetical protein
LSDGELKIAERMFQALTDTDARNRSARRPAHLSEIVAITGASRETILNVIKRFTSEGRSFLTVTGDDDLLIDISHESLIRQWGRMGEWVKTEAEWRDRYKRLAHDAEIHEKSGGKKRDLLRGAQLDLALEWQAEREPNRVWARRYHPDIKPEDSDRLFDRAIGFLEESKNARDEEDLARRRQLRNRRVAAALLALLGFGLATFYAIQAMNLQQLRQLADQFRKGAESQRLASYFPGIGRLGGYSYYDPIIRPSQLRSSGSSTGIRRKHVYGHIPWIPGRDPQPMVNTT